MISFLLSPFSSLTLGQLSAELLGVALTFLTLAGGAAAWLWRLSERFARHSAAQLRVCEILDRQQSLLERVEAKAHEHSETLAAAAQRLSDIERRLDALEQRERGN